MGLGPRWAPHFFRILLCVPGRCYHRRGRWPHPHDLLPGLALFVAPLPSSSSRRLLWSAPSWALPACLFRAEAQCWGNDGPGSSLHRAGWAGLVFFTLFTFFLSGEYAIGVFLKAKWQFWCHCSDKELNMYFSLLMIYKSLSLMANKVLMERYHPLKTEVFFEGGGFLLIFRSIKVTWEKQRKIKNFCFKLYYYPRIIFFTIILMFSYLSPILMSPIFNV